MEVFDADEEHLSAILPQEKEDELSIEKPSWEPPTAAARTMAASTAPHRPHKVNTTKRATTSSEPNVDYASKSPGLVSMDARDIDSSVQRYQLLPAYARRNFVSVEDTKNNTNDESSHLDYAPFAETHSLPVDNNDDLESELPPDMVTPPTRRMRDVVRLTATKSAGAPQFEVLLKVKQHDNPDFAFLQLHHTHHTYYEWLKKRRRKRDDPSPDAADDESEQVNHSNCGVVSDLLGMYSSSSDEEEGDEGHDSDKAVDVVRKSIEGAPASMDLMNPSIEEAKGTEASQSPVASLLATGVDDETKAKRLKRAKLMSGHFRLQLLDS